MLDHNFDQLSHVFFLVCNLAALRAGPRLNRVLMGINGQLLPHYTIEYRKHFTRFHSTVVETSGGLVQIGATEEAMMIMLI